MIRTPTHSVILSTLSLLIGIPSASAQIVDQPITRLRPIGSTSAVDRYRSVDSSSMVKKVRSGEIDQRADAADIRFNNDTSATYRVRQVGDSADSAVRQTAMLQQFTAPPMQGSMPMPGSVPPPVAPPITPAQTPPIIPMPSSDASVLAPPTMPPLGLPAGGGNLTPAPIRPLGQIPSSSDLVPLADPSLNDGFATIDNCSCVSAPSDYDPSTPCPPPVATAIVPYGAPPAYVAPPVATPGKFPPAVGAGPTCKSLISFGQHRNSVVVGPGIIGQPVAYVPGQWFRNGIRYISP